MHQQTFHKRSSVDPTVRDSYAGEPALGYSNKQVTVQSQRATTARRVRSRLTAGATSLPSHEGTHLNERSQERPHGFIQEKTSVAQGEQFSQGLGGSNFNEAHYASQPKQQRPSEYISSHGLNGQTLNQASDHLMSKATNQRAAGRVAFAKSGAGDDIHSSEAESNSRPKRNIKQLIDSVWPQDPLEEAQRNGVIEVGELLGGAAHNARLRRLTAPADSQLKQSLQRIQETELKLSDMVSRHIKSKGTQKFTNSSFVITDRNASVKKSSVNLTCSTPAGSHLGGIARKLSSKRAVSSPATGGKRKKSQLKGKAGAKKTALGKGEVQMVELDVHAQVKQILDTGRTSDDQNQEKLHQLACFKPQEIFNINTHALFQKVKPKDPLDSEDDSNDDDEEIIRLLRTVHSREGIEPPKGKIDLQHSKIDLKAYNPNKSIDHNIKVLRGMITRVKQATNTTRSASLAQGRREQLKLSKFMKKDTSTLKPSKIARETAQAIKYLNKRQPLTVQNTQAVNDENQFSLPSKRTTLPDNTSQAETSQSPQKQQAALELQHAGQKAKFYRNVNGPAYHSSAINSGFPSGAASESTSLNAFGSQRTSQEVGGKKMTSQGILHHTSQQQVAQRLMSKESPLKGHLTHSQSRARISNQNPSTFSKQGPSSAHQQALFQMQRKRRQVSASTYRGHAQLETKGQPARNLRHSLAHDVYQDQAGLGGDGAHMHIESGSSEIAALGGLYPLASLTSETPLAAGSAVHLHQPTIVNNITVVAKRSQNVLSSGGVAQMDKAQRQKRYNRNSSQPAAIRISSRQRHPQSRTTHLTSRTGGINPGKGIGRINQAQPSSNLSSLNFHPHSSTHDEGATSQTALDDSLALKAPSAEQLYGQGTPLQGEQNQLLLNAASSRFLRNNRIQTSQDGTSPQGSGPGMGRINETVESKSVEDFSVISHAPHTTNRVTWGHDRVGTGLDQTEIEPNQTLLACQQTSQFFAASLLPMRKKSSAVVKVDRTVLEKEPTLSVMDMLRILDARNGDMGLKKQLNEDTCTPQTLSKLIREFTDGSGQGPAQRFKDYCLQKCVNRKLVLQDFSLGQSAAQEIASILAVNRDIVHVDLSKNNLQDAGVEALVRVLKNHTAIVHLDLTQNNVTAKGAKKVFKALTNNISLISLKIGNVENVNKNRLGVKAMPKLNKFVRQSAVLSFLDIRSTNLTDAGLILLSQALAGNSTLFCLNISKNDLTCAGVEAFAPVLASTALKDLDLSMNPLGNNGVRILSAHLFEQVLDERRRSYKRGNKCALRKLNLAETKFQEQGAFHLFKNLIEFHSLEYLVLDYNQFESKNMTPLSSFIKQTRVATLSINHCKLGDAGGLAVGEALALAPSIRELSAKNNEFRDATAKEIAQALEENANVERLDLSSNLINDSGGELLGLALQGNQNLQVLNLRKNNLRATSGAMFARSMKENKTLKSLRLQKNSINLNFLEQIDACIERNNVYILENSVNELRENRQGFLQTRLKAWADVRERDRLYAQRTAKLTAKVEEKLRDKSRLTDDMDREIENLKQIEKEFRTGTSGSTCVLEELNQQIRMKQGLAEKKKGQLEGMIGSYNNLIETNKVWIETQRQDLLEQQETYAQHENDLLKKLAAADNLLKKICS